MVGLCGAILSTAYSRQSQLEFQLYERSNNILLGGLSALPGRDLGSNLEWSEGRLGILDPRPKGIRPAGGKDRSCPGPDGAPRSPS